MTLHPLLRRLLRVSMAGADGICWQLQCSCEKMLPLAAGMHNASSDAMARARCAEPSCTRSSRTSLRGIAALLDCAWLALFSAVLPPKVDRRETPSFHVWDPEEEYVSQCKDMSGYFLNKEVHEHREGHIVPNKQEIVRKLAAFAMAAR